MSELEIEVLRLLASDEPSDRLDALRQLWNERQEALNYAKHLFSTVAPQCEPLDSVAGILTQLDNYIAGQKLERQKDKALLEEAREALAMVSRLADYQDGDAILYGSAADKRIKQILTKLTEAKEKL